jgi:nucleoside-diphosphate-sugar epimerase
VGFLGGRLVKRLLERGETKIRLFDISPHNPFAGNPNVEFCRGDVTKYEQILKACQGVDTVYCTFAIIRFMDRLEHQKALSERINVLGSDNVTRACKEANVRYVVVTSSSHATTDSHSEPRFNRDETAPYVTRETAHNHYGWTKAIADQAMLAANGSKTPDGGKMLVSIVRPCSGIFGADDRFSMEKALSLSILPIFCGHYEMDWVYVENVVLGHLLCEAHLRVGDGAGIAGEAFCISNDEAVSNTDFWWSVKKHHMQRGYTTAFDCVHIPVSPMWLTAYVSETNQRIFKGALSLGPDIDIVTPAMLHTTLMTYVTHCSQNVISTIYIYIYMCIYIYVYICIYM